MSNGLPSMVVVGLPDKALDEARERVKGAIRNSGLNMPTKRITVNLAPADLPKDGTAYDLGLALAILTASGQIASPPDAIFAGELALDGNLRPIRGVIGHANLAKSLRIPQIFLPSANAEEAALVNGVSIYPVENLRQLYRHLIGEELITPLSPQQPVPRVSAGIDMADIYGQSLAKRALEIAAAGGHNLLFTGPPGSGKTMLAKALIGILPPPTTSEIIEMTALHNIAGRSGVVTERPLRSPHHTASDVAIIGGGRNPQPGEISLSHRGVLFLDELPEFSRSVLESLRQPLEDGMVTVSRATAQTTFPARCQLVAASNPCPCGYAGDNTKSCSCSPAQVAKYAKRLSGPVLDRIDLIVNVARVDKAALLQARPAESSQLIAARVARARQIQTDRLSRSSGFCNADLDNQQIRLWCRLDSQASDIARSALASLGLSARAYFRVLKVARTIADLDGASDIASQHLSEALQYRPTIG